MKKLVLILLSTLTLMSQALANSAHVVAVVNDNAITQNDLDNRTKLLLLSTGFDSTDESALRAFKGQVLQLLIDEQLVNAEAQKLEIEVEDDEVNQALSEIAARNNLSILQFADTVSNSGASMVEFKKQIKGQLLWQKIIKFKIEPAIVVTQHEIDEVAKVEAKDHSASDLFINLSEIVLLDDKKKASKVFADDLIKQIREGASFENIARDFSQASSASAGGYLGDKFLSQLPPEFHKHLKDAKPGSIIGPIVYKDNLFILKINDLKSEDIADLTTKQISDSIKEAKLNNDIRAYVRKLRKTNYIKLIN
jgi:peptidyl-prolyl cis-trans isomerase SurA